MELFAIEVVFAILPWEEGGDWETVESLSCTTGGGIVVVVVATVGPGEGLPLPTDRSGGVLGNGGIGCSGGLVEMEPIGFGGSAGFVAVVAVAIDLLPLEDSLGVTTLTIVGISTFNFNGDRLLV